MRTKIYEALSKEQKSNLITFMPTNASLADVMGQLESIELWNKMGNDKDWGRDSALRVGLGDKDGFRGRGSTEGPPSSGFASRLDWAAYWASRGVDVNSVGCGFCGHHGHRKSSCPEN